MTTALAEKFNQEQEEIWRLPKVTGVTGFSKPTIYRMMQEGNFPKQFRLGKRAVGWKKSVINNWLYNLKEA